MDLTNGIEKVKGLLKKCGDLWGNFLTFLGEEWKGITGKIKSASDRILGRFPEGTRRLILLASGALVILLFVLVFSTLALASRRPAQAASPELPSGLSIPMADLFIPAEPDFIPGFLFEREVRHTWTLEDINPYWKIPGNPDLWRREIRSAVDILMEDIP